MKCFYFATLILLAALLSGTNVSGQNPGDITCKATFSNIAYETADTNCVLDIYITPKGSGNTPAIIAISTLSDQKSDKLQQILQALPYGYSVVAPAPDSSVVKSIKNVVSVIKWIKKYGRQYSLDPQKIILWGYSQGGYIAATAGCAGTYRQGFESEMEFYTSEQMATAQKNEQQLQKAAESFGIYTTGNATKVQAVVDIYGPFLLRGNSLSPQMFITPQSPPFFMMYGKNDTTVPFETANAFASNLRSAIGSELVEYILLPEADCDDKIFENPQLFTQIFVFLDRILHLNQ